MKGVQQAASRQPRLLDQVRNKIRLKHYSIRTEQAYIDWIKRFILFHDKRHPNEMGAAEVEQFLSHLAVDRNVASSTQNQALSAILFLYREVLEIELPWLENVQRAKKPQRLPVVLTRDQVRTVLARLDGRNRLMANLLYGAGLRLMECLRLRVKDVDFDYHQIIVRDGKGQKDRVTMLPDRVVEPLQDHLNQVQIIHRQDLEEGFGEVYLPFALERKYPNAAREWAGSTSSRPVNARSIHVRIKPAAIISTRKYCNVRSRMLYAAPVLINRPVATLFVIRLPLICWKTATISVPCRNCWAIKTSARR
jgi:integron integrase